MKFKPYILAVLLTETLGIITGLVIRNGVEIYSTLPKPALSPPAIVFPIVWTILYALMGIGLARIWLQPSSSERNMGLNLFWLQLFFNLMWSIIFFNFQAFGFAFFWILGLWVLILAMIIVWNKVDSLAAKLQIPYLLWVTFAAYLNYSVWMMNQ